MIPARTQCPDGWTTEYAGYLVSDHITAPRHRTSYVCWDEAPEIAVGGSSLNQAVIYPVEILCGSLPCSMYPTGRELPCIVCSKWHTWQTLSSLFLLLFITPAVSRSSCHSWAWTCNRRFDNSLVVYGRPAGSVPYFAFITAPVLPFLFTDRDAAITMNRLK